MTKSIKNIKANDEITFCEKTKQIFDLEKIYVSNVKKYIYEENEIVMIESDDFLVFYYNLDDEDKYFVYEEIVSGDINEIEQEGCYFLNEDSDFKSKIVNKDGVKPQVYKQSETGILCGLVDAENENYEISLCEYQCPSCVMSNMLVIKTEKENSAFIQAYHGFKVNKKDIKVH